MSQTETKLHEVIPEAFAKALLAGEVVIPEIGTFYLTRYVKKLHPIMVKGQRTKKMKSAFVKNKKLVLVRFKPSHILKNRILGN